STDFITKTAAQTITATLSGAPAGTDIVYGSLDNGATWTDITSKVSGTTLTWNGVTLTASSTLKLKVTDNAGNDGTVLSQAYVLDTTAPTITSAITASGSYGTPLATYNITANESVASYSATGLPGGVTVNTGTGAISGTPTAIGSFTVTLGATDPAGNAGSNTLTLTIAKASQTVSFATIGSVTIGTPVTLSASASSGLAVTFSVVSGNATISGSALTVNDSSSVVVRASQAGDSNYNSASADQTIAASAKLDQTITFAALPDRRVGDAPFTLTATASSGLPVAFAIVSGPALLSGATLTLGGTPGTVTVRASQPGNAAYNAAPDVVRAFTVAPAGPSIFFGSLGSSTIAAEITPNGQSGTIIGTIPGTGDGFVVNFTLDATGHFVTPATVFLNPQSTATAVAADAATGTEHALTVAATASTRTFRGLWSGGVLSGSLDELSLTFSAAQQPPTGPTAAIAGYYTAASTNTATGSTYSVVGTQGQVYVLAVTPTLVTAGSGTVAANSTQFTVQTPAAATIAAAIDTPTTTVTGTITLPNQTTQTFSGLNATTVRTDRLISLSSRAWVNDPAGDAGALIAGFVITGAVPKPVLLRAIGPSLAAYGVHNPLADPRLILYDATGHVIQTNDNWGGTSALVTTQARLGAFALDPASKDAVLLVTLAPGLYTMQVADNGGQGVALAEVYDASDNPQAEYQRLIDISTRGPVTAGEGALIGGFSVTGNSPKKVLVRGIGPGLTAYGVPGALADPLLTVYNAAGVALAQNDQWETSDPLTAAQTSASPADLSAAFTSTSAFALAHGSKDAALIVVLAPGAYTAVVSGVGGQTGVALVEIYEIPVGN
ncbi:MAG TPA: Ig domain-containing protein, partial [Opitutaceae bacterium]|nr:Ig domain-containing protein [Opitutaceae bacterium]